MKKSTKTVVAVLLVLVILLINFSTIVKATGADLTRTTGSLTITKYEKGATGHEGENTPLQGVRFAIYKVADGETSTTAPSGNPLRQETTNSSGQAAFSNLELGRYLVVETAVPENVTERIANFLVDIPQTGTNGTSLEYDVNVYPKNNTAYGSITLIKEGQSGEKLQGVVFELLKKNGANWETYNGGATVTATTNANGQITAEGLPVGTYGFVEKSLGTNDGYILDNKTIYQFTVALQQDNTTLVTPSTITVTNPKPTIQKVITAVTRDTNDTNTVTDGITSLDIGDVVTYKITTDVPRTIAEMNTYKITDTMDSSLTYLATNFTIQGVTAGGEKTTLTKDTDYTVTAQDHQFEVTFTNANLASYTKLETSYDAKLNSSADMTATGNKNTVQLDYSNAVKTNYKSETNEVSNKTAGPVETKVYSGGFKIEKRENSNTGTLITTPAKFKIASTRANAEAKTFIKDATGTEIVLTTVNGRVEYKGLSYGKYYLVEVEAPTYTEDNETKYYNLLNKPVEINVDVDSYDTETNIVINRKPTILPLTGSYGSVLLISLGVALILAGVIIVKKNKNK